jgi:hypothetical protein
MSQEDVLRWLGANPGWSGQFDGEDQEIRLAQISAGSFERGACRASLASGERGVLSIARRRISEYRGVKK